MPLYTTLLAAIGGLLVGTYCPRLGSFSKGAVEPEFPFSTFDATSVELQAVCTAHGRLQLLAKYPSDAVTAFEFLNLDPKARPFYPRDASRRGGDRWHRELLELVDNEYTDRIDRLKHAGKEHARGDTDLQQYREALAAVSDLLQKDSPRRFYVETVLPMLERVRRGQPSRCVWPRVRKFNRDLRGAAWRVTGLLGDLEEAGRAVFATDGCLDQAKSSG